MKTTRAKKTSVLLSTVLDPRGQPTATVQPHPLATLIAEKGIAQNQVVHVEAAEECLSFKFARLAAAS